MTKTEQFMQYVTFRLGEASTWQGVAFILTLCGSKYAALDWGQAAALGASVSAGLKIFFPDAKEVK